MYYIIAQDKIWSTGNKPSFIVWQRETKEEALKQLEIANNRSDISCCRICTEKPVPKDNEQMSYYDKQNDLIESIGEPDFEKSR